MIILKIINKKKTLKAKFGINFPDVLLARLQDKTVEPTKETQEIISDEKFDGLGKVTVNPIPDEYIIPEGLLPITENATYDVTKYAKVSTSVHPAPNLQDKSITINENGTQNITFDDGYDGLNQVDVTIEVEGKEDLTEELTVYGTELEEQNVTLDDIVEALQGKGSGSGSGSLEIYSTKEVLTNSTWIDGKPIYRIVVQITLPASIKEGTYSSASADLTSLNIDTPVNVSGLVKKSSGTEYWNINTYNNTLSTNDSIWCSLGGSGTSVYVSTNASAYAGASVNIIVEYTKAE